jgi:hypothetical protein
LGEGSVIVGLVIGAQVYAVHQFDNSSVATGVYMSNPNLPLRWEIANSGAGAAADLDCVCGTIISEGGTSDVGVTYSVDRGETSLVTLNNSNIYPLLAWRVGSGFPGAQIKLRAFQTLCTSTSDYRWLIVYNPTVVGTALSFSARTSTAIDVATPTNGTTITGGTVVASGYQQAGSVASSQVATTVADLWPGIGADGVQDVIVLAVQRLSGTTETFYGSVTLTEQV